MGKKIGSIILFGFLVFQSVFAAPIESPLSVPNGDFSLAEGTAIPSWTRTYRYGTNTDSLRNIIFESLDNSTDINDGGDIIPASGGKVLHLRFSSSNKNDGMAVYSDPIAVQPGKTYRLEVDAWSYGSLGFGIAFLNEKDRVYTSYNGEVCYRNALIDSDTATNINYTDNEAFQTRYQDNLTAEQKMKWYTYSAEYKAPEDASKARIMLVCPGGYTTNTFFKEIRLNETKELKLEVVNSSFTSDYSGWTLNGDVSAETVLFETLAKNPSQYYGRNGNGLRISSAGGEGKLESDFITFPGAGEYWFDFYTHIPAGATLTYQLQLYDRNKQPITQNMPGKILAGTGAICSAYIPEPHSTEKGNIVFSVPEGAKYAKLQFQPSAGAAVTIDEVLGNYKIDATDIRVEQPMYRIAAEADREVTALNQAAGKNLTVHLSFSNFTEENKSFLSMVGLYNKQAHRIAQLKIVPCTLEAMKTMEIKIELPIPEKTENFYVKPIIIDDFFNLTSLATNLLILE